MLAKDGAFEKEHDKRTDVLLDRGKSSGRRIRCPKCRWQPRSDSHWACSCGHAWNTFDTAALCPACGRQWEMTICLRCHQWSRHIDWYERGDSQGPASA